MKLSDNTLNILKNFSTINPNLVFKEGNQLKTISVAKNILATATIDETIPSEFGIYDLPEFLSVIGLIEDAELVIGDTSAKIRGDGDSLNYFFSDVSNLTTPQKDITMPKCEIEFDLTEVSLGKLRRAASTMGVSEVLVVGEENGVGISIQVVDTKNPTSNSYQLDLPTETVVRPSNELKWYSTLVTLSSPLATTVVN